MIVTYCTHFCCGSNVLVKVNADRKRAKAKAGNTCGVWNAHMWSLWQYIWSATIWFRRNCQIIAVGNPGELWVNREVRVVRTILLYPGMLVMCKPLLISTWLFGYQFYWFLQQSLNECESFTMCGVKLSACQRENVTLTLGHCKNGYDCSLSLSLERTQFNFKLTT